MWRLVLISTAMSVRVAHPWCCMQAQMSMAPLSFTSCIATRVSAAAQICFRLLAMASWERPWPCGRKRRHDRGARQEMTLTSSLRTVSPSLYMWAQARAHRFLGWACAAAPWDCLLSGQLGGDVGCRVRVRTARKASCMRGATVQTSAMAAAATCCARMFLLSSTPTREDITSCIRSRHCCPLHECRTHSQPPSAWA